jgi:hypothetical protein
VRRPNKEWDKKVSTYLLKQAVGVEREVMTTSASILPMHFFREYVLYVREQLSPRMSPGARKLLTRYYKLLRQGDERSMARTTVRLLESLLRLAEAHAKLMFHEEVSVEDAIVAIFCVQLSQAATQASVLTSDAMMQSEFPKDPREQYQEAERDVLRKLHLSPADLDDLRRCSETDESDNRQSPPTPLPRTISPSLQTLPAPWGRPVTSGGRIGGAAESAANVGRSSQSPATDWRRRDVTTTSKSQVHDWRAGAFRGLSADEEKEGLEDAQEKRKCLDKGIEVIARLPQDVLPVVFDDVDDW